MDYGDPVGIVRARLNKVSRGEEGGGWTRREEKGGKGRKREEKGEGRGEMMRRKKNNEGIRIQQKEVGEDDRHQNLHYKPSTHICFVSKRLNELKRERRRYKTALL